MDSQKCSGREDKKKFSVSQISFFRHIFFTMYSYS